MLLNFYFYLLNFKVLAVYSLWVVIFPLSRSGYVDFIDIYSRTLVSDFFTNTYYYFWTAFWYIPTLLFFLLLIMFFVNNLHTNKLVLLVTPLPALFMYELLDYWNLNTTYTNLTLNSDNLNLLLTNSINKYHPFLFYYVLISLPLTYCFWIFTTYLTPTVFFYKTKSYPLTITLRKYKPLVITFTLFLGSWWALQEGSWGGWWNWDPSEVFGLIVMFMVLASTHNKPSILNTYFFRSKLTISSVAVCITYVFIQLNFNLVSHNFGIKVAGFINTAQFFSILLTILSLILICTLVYVRVTGAKLTALLLIKPVYTRSNTLFYFLLLLLFTSLEVLVSFYPLINDFYWKIMDLNTLNWFVSFDNIVSYLVIILLTLLWRSSVYVVVLLFILQLFGYWLTLLTTFIVGNRLHIFKLHTVTLLFLLTSIYGYYTVETFWSVLEWYTCVNAFSGVGTVFYEYYSLLLGYAYTTTPHTTNNLGNLSPSAFYHSSTSLETNNFQLLNTGTVTYQNLLSDLFFKKFTVSVADSSILILCDTASVLFIAYWFIFPKKTVIIF